MTPANTAPIPPPALLAELFAIVALFSVASQREIKVPPPVAFVPVDLLPLTDSFIKRILIRPIDTLPSLLMS